MLKALLLLISLTAELSIAGEYSDCILENMKGINDRYAAIEVQHACKIMALPHIPKKCLEIKAKTEEQLLEYEKNNPITQESSVNPFLNDFLKPRPYPDAAMNECLKSCLDSSYWSKHFGECKE